MNLPSEQRHAWRGGSDFDLKLYLYLYLYLYVTVHLQKRLLKQYIVDF